MAVIGKFYVSSIVHHDGKPTADKVTLGAVCRGAQNKQWSSATPWGTIEMGILNDDATAQFEEGEEYEVVFTKVPKPKQGDGHEPVPYSFSDPKWVECGVCGMGPANPGQPDPDWSKHEELYGSSD